MTTTTAVPKAAERAAGVDVTARRSFAAPGRNVRLDAHADRTADRFANDRRTDTGEVRQFTGVAGCVECKVTFPPLPGSLWVQTTSIVH